MTQSRLILRTGLAAFIVAAAFIPVHRVRAAGFDDYTSLRNARVDAGGARTIEVRAGAGDVVFIKSVHARRKQRLLEVDAGPESC